MLGLRDYQQELYIKSREALKEHRSICVQLATGGGKTPLLSAMFDSVYNKNKIAWVIVPRIELITQSSNHLKKWKVPHSLIKPGYSEKNSFKIYVVSSDTLIRRFDKIKNWPDLLVIDEAHLHLDRQLKIYKYLPKHTKIIGLTATPERLDGRGLWSGAGGLYDVLIEGPSIPELTKQGFLTDVDYYSPPLEGIENIKFKGYDASIEDLEDLLKRKKVYGKSIDHYNKYGKNKSALMFYSSVKAAYESAEMFRDNGHSFYCIEGKMTDKKRQSIIDAHTNGEIEGITNCKLATYGVDIPRIEYIGDLALTASFPLFMQKIGRGIRPFIDEKTGYKKERLIYFDHVNQILEHGIEYYDNGEKKVIPPHYAQKIDWNFKGTEKRKRKKDKTILRCCPYLDFMYCQKSSCLNCDKNPNKNIEDVKKPILVVPVELEKIKKPLSLKERPEAEQKEIQDRIGKAQIDYKTTMSNGAIGEMIKIANELGYKDMWIYWKLTEESRYTINIPLLAEIARQQGYKKGWVYFAQKQIKAKINANNEYRRILS